MFINQIQMLKNQVIKIAGYSQQKLNHPKSFGKKKSRSFDKSFQTGVLNNTLSMVSAAALWRSVSRKIQNYQVLCSFTLKSS